VSEKREFPPSTPFPEKKAGAYVRTEEKKEGALGEKKEEQPKQEKLKCPACDYQTYFEENLAWHKSKFHEKSMAQIGELLELRAQRQATQPPAPAAPVNPSPATARGGMRDCPNCRGIGWVYLDIPMVSPATGDIDPRFGKAFPCWCLKKAQEIRRQNKASLK
jgi:hypothetical protein